MADVDAIEDQRVPVGYDSARAAETPMRDLPRISLRASSGCRMRPTEGGQFELSE
jgi:hypothetical protein